MHRRASPLPVEVPLAEVAGFVAQASARRAELQVVSVQVEIPAEILRLGFEFVDTPGVGSAIEINTATTRQFLPEADAVIFVTGFDSPLTEAEAAFLADAARYAGRLLLALNKRNLVSAVTPPKRWSSYAAACATTWGSASRACPACRRWRRWRRSFRVTAGDCPAAVSRSFAARWTNS